MSTVPSSVRDLFVAAGLEPRGQVAWGEPLPEAQAGVYVVALTADADELARWRELTLDEGALATLLERAELRVDGALATRDGLAARLRGCWLQNESVVYVGCTRRPLGTRVGEYYRTPLGARAPHAGGWPVKTLSCPLFVHYAETHDFIRAERAMLDAFAAATDATVRAHLHDPARPIPYANLGWPGHGRKAHGIASARG